MQETSWLSVMLSAGMFVVGLFGIGLILARLYKRATKEVAFVRTGFGGQKVILDGGALIIPILHETVPVNMNTIRLDVSRKEEQSLITKDRMRVDVTAEFYLRVSPTTEGISAAAQTTGDKTCHPEDLKKLMEAKFVDALRSAAAQMTMHELQDQRTDFVKKVHEVVSEELRKNGLELETVSLTSLDQTNKRFFNPENAFDAEGLTRLTQETENRRKERNKIEQEIEVEVREKNLEAEKRKLELEQMTKFAQMDQTREVETREAETQALISKQQAERHREAETARIESEREIASREIERERTLESARIEQRKAVEIAAIEKDKMVKIAEQERAIQIAKHSEAQSQAEAEANKARAESVRMEQEVITVKAVTEAEMQKKVAIVEAEKQAEKEAVAEVVAAETRKKAASALAEAKLAEARAIADSDKLLAEGLRVKYEAEADGSRKLNEAKNSLSHEMIQMEVKLALVKALPEIITAATKPMEKISDIRVVEIGGLSGGTQGKEAGSSGGDGNLAESAVNAALRYRAHAPFLDSIMKEVGMSSSLNGMLAAAAALTENKETESVSDAPSALR